MSLSAKDRRAIRKRDNFTCQRCGTNKRRAGNTKLHVHHIVELELGGTDDPENLRTLCTRCHGYIHDQRAKEREREARENNPFAYTLAAAARCLECAPETIKRMAAIGDLEEVHGIVGHARIVTAESVERYEREKLAREASQ